jgi:hypothetical protein
MHRDQGRGQPFAHLRKDIKQHQRVASATEAQPDSSGSRESDEPGLKPGLHRRDQ